MDNAEQETEFQEIQRLHDGLKVKVGAVLDKYSKLPFDVMSKKCDDLAQELQKLHKIEMDMLSRFRKNQFANKVYPIVDQPRMQQQAQQPQQIQRWGFPQPQPQSQSHLQSQRPPENTPNAASATTAVADLIVGWGNIDFDEGSNGKPEESKNEEKVFESSDHEQFFAKQKSGIEIRHQAKCVIKGLSDLETYGSEFETFESMKVLYVTILDT